MLIIFLVSCFVIAGCPLAPPEEWIDKDEAERIAGDYYIHANRIYVYEEHDELSLVADADARSFRVLSRDYALDGQHVFYYSNVIDKADVATFQALGETPFAKDSHRAYCYGYVIPGVDVGTFTALNDHYARDKNHIYQYYRAKNHIVAGADVNSFRVFNDISAFAVDRFHAYYDGTPLEGADLKSFRLIGSGYAKDKNRIYCLDESIADFDLHSFQIIDSGTYGKDKDGIYALYSHCGPKKELRLSDEVDPDTFEEVYIHQEAFYTKDKNHVYLDGGVLEGVDPKTFRVLNFYYSLDKNGVYELGKRMQGVDPKTFDPDTFDYRKWKHENESVTSP